MLCVVSTSVEYKLGYLEAFDEFVDLSEHTRMYSTYCRRRRRGDGAGPRVACDIVSTRAVQIHFATKATDFDSPSAESKSLPLQNRFNSQTQGVIESQRSRAFRSKVLDVLYLSCEEIARPVLR